jgi:hypothetical protein
MKDEYVLVWLWPIDFHAYKTYKIINLILGKNFFLVLYLLKIYYKLKFNNIIA